MLGRVVDFEPLGEPAGFGGRERFVEARRRVGVEVIQDEHDALSFRMDLIHQSFHHLGKVEPGAPLPDPGVAGVGQRLKGHEHVARSGPGVFKVLPHGLPGLCWQRLASVRAQFPSCLVQANERTAWIQGPLVNFEHVLHVPDAPRRSALAG